MVTATLAQAAPNIASASKKGARWNRTTINRLVNDGTVGVSPGLLGLQSRPAGEVHSARGDREAVCDHLPLVSS